jgi:hypothetical protein
MTDVRKWDLAEVGRFLSGSPIARQPAASPTKVPTRRLKNLFDMTMQRAQNANPRELGRTTEFRCLDQAAHGGLPFQGFLVCLWELQDIGRSA